MPAVSLSECWQKLEEGAMQLMEYRSDMGTSLGKKNFPWMEYYTLVYDYCTQQSPPSSSQAIAGLDLYEKLRYFLTEHCQQIRKALQQLTGDALIELYNSRWSYFLFSCKVLSNICAYLNRHCVSRAKEDQKAHVYEIPQLALYIWLTEIYHPLHENVVNALLSLTDRERRGENIRTSMLNAAIRSLVTLGISDDAQNTDVLSVYEDFFEKPYLQRLHEHYIEEGKRHLAESSVCDFMSLAEKQIEEEVDRVSRYLHSSTKTKIEKMCNDALITRNIELFNAEAKVLLSEDRNKDLGRMYRLLSRVADGTDSMRSVLETHICEVGRKAVDSLGEISSSNEDAVKYAECLLSVHTKYLQLVNTAFGEDLKFIESLDRACRLFVNSNAMTKASKNARSPELLARYTDALLKKSSKNPPEDKIEQLLQQVIIIFNYIEDKDIFERFYKKMLAARLINDRSASDDAESSMISKLKAASGADYTRKLQRMFQDMETNKQSNAKFKEFLQNAGGVGYDLKVRVLTTTCWPYNSGIQMQLPSVLMRGMEFFTTYYSKEHESRRLQWLFQHCKGEITMKGKKTHIFEANTLQMALMMPFNTVASLSFDNLVEITQMPADTVKPQVDLLLKARILKEQAGNYIVNADYNHKKTRLRIDQPIKSVEKKENEATHEHAEQERILIIKACLVRVMKTRKTLKHTELIRETLEQLNSRFKPKVTNIKRTIETLIEQDYLKRRDGTRDTYEYVA